MNLTAFGPYSEAIFDLVKKRLISDGNALGPLAFPKNLFLEGRFGPQNGPAKN
jgi:hypothetical protein